MRKSWFKFPKLCLSTILIEIGIVCALVAVNTRPMSYGPSSQNQALQMQLGGAAVPTNPSNNLNPGSTSFTFLGDGSLDGDTDLGDEWNIHVANYGWPFKSVEVTTETREVHYVDKKRLAANIAICLAIVVSSAIATEWSVRYARQKQKSGEIAG